MTRFHILLLVVGFVPVAGGLFCDVCKTNYDNIIKGLTTDEDRCTTSKVYIQCLVSATGRGCDTRPDKLKVAKDEIDRINSSPSTPCHEVQGPGLIECINSSNYVTHVVYQYLIGSSSIIQNECAINATGVRCDEVTTNEAFNQLTRQKWMDVCGGQDSNQMLSPIIITASAFTGILGEQ